MDKNSNVELVDDIITFFQGLGASNELNNRNFDTGDFFSEEYCNYILEIAKKYDLYDKSEEAKDVNYILTLEDSISDFFKEKLVMAFSTDKS